MRPTLFLDCDGVLADFEALASVVLTMPTRQFIDLHGLEPMWMCLRSYDDFFYRLPFLHDASTLWEGVQHLRPVILTACPRSQTGGWVEEQKRRWIHEMLGDVPVVMAYRGQKHPHLRQTGDILVDDSVKYRRRWKRAGGVFIHHQTALATLRELRELHPDWFH